MFSVADLASVSRDVSATRSRTKKIARIASALSTLSPEEVPPIVGFLCGEPRQGKLGLGYGAFKELSALAVPAQARVTALELDATFSELANCAGKGAARERARILRDLYLKLSGDERDFVSRLVLGALRQGALESVV
ncbi:MAG TPA: ATP-dependent DNA ligase, partial [Polyangiaceae bacterium]